MNNKINVALVCGGYSKEKEISVMGAESIEKHIPADRYRVFKIVVEPDRWYYLAPDGSTQDVDKNNFTLPGVAFDVAYINIHGTPGENGLLQGYFDMLRIPYTTCDACTSALTFNKAFCNATLGYHGVRVAKSIHLVRHEKYDAEAIGREIGFPCFVKPACDGSSFGVSKVMEAAHLHEAIEKTFADAKEVLVERFVQGKEYSCGLMRLKGEVIVFPLAAIVPENDFFDYEAKYLGKSKEIVPAPVCENLRKQMAEISANVYRILNCKGVVRCDFIVEESTQQPYFLEINTTPGQSPESIVPKQIRHMGWTLEDLYDNVLQEALRNAGKL